MLSYNLQNQKPKKLFLLQIIFATSFISLTSGTLLSGLAFLIGANDTIVSYIAVIPNICGIFIVVFVPLLEKSHKKKRKAIILSILSKFFAVSVIFTFAIEQKNIRVVTFVIIGILSYTLQALSTLVMNNWLIDFINTDKAKGQYISFRQKLIVICTLIVSFAAGRIMDLDNSKYLNYIIVYSIAFLVAIIEISVLLKIDDSTCDVKEKQQLKVHDILRNLVRNKRFLNYLCYITFFYFALYIADSSTTIYMMKYLKYSYTKIAFVQMLMTLPQLFLLKPFGKMVDKLGSMRVLYFSIWFFAGETLFFAFSNQSNSLLCVSIAFLITSFANSGFTVSSFSSRYEIIPEEGRMIYDSVYGAFIGISFILAPLIGGGIKNFISTNKILKGTIQFPEIRLLYLTSTILLLLIQVVISFSPYYREKKSSSRITQSDSTDHQQPCNS